MTKVLIRIGSPGVSYSNIIWADRDRGSAYYRHSRFLSRGWTKDHPVCPGGDGRMDGNGQIGTSPTLEAFRGRGYYASCFPEGDGISFREKDERSFEQIKRDVEECFGFQVVTNEREVYRQWDAPVPGGAA